MVGGDNSSLLTATFGWLNLKVGGHIIIIIIIIIIHA